MVLWIIPVVVWSLHGTVISLRDILVTVRYPLASTIGAGGLAFGVRLVYGHSSLSRLALESAVLLSVYVGMLLFVMRQKSFYLSLLRNLLGHSSAKEAAPVSA
jgi:hypothetical protein